MPALEARLARYKEPSSTTEKAKQDRAERMVRDTTSGWSGLPEMESRRSVGVRRH